MMFYRKNIMAPSRAISNFVIYFEKVTFFNHSLGIKTYFLPPNWFYKGFPIVILSRQSVKSPRQFLLVVNLIFYFLLSRNWYFCSQGIDIFVLIGSFVLSIDFFVHSIDINVLRGSIFLLSPSTILFSVSILLFSPSIFLFSEHR